MMRFPTLFFFLVVGLASCSPRLTPFTVDLVDENRWSEAELQEIQFFLSQDVVPGAVDPSAKYRDRAWDRSSQREGRDIERIVIPSGTPGVVVYAPRNEKLAISFEQGDEYYLIFSPHPRRDGRYVLNAQNWQEGRGQLTYGGRPYYTLAGSGLASLMVDLRSTRRQSVRSRQASGRTVD